MKRCRRNVTTLVVAAVAALIFPTAASAQARPQDVQSVDGVITALYESISGPMGAERDFERFRALFAPDGRLMPASAQAPSGYAAWTPEDYWERNAESLSRIGFNEVEIGRVTETFGRVTHVFSAYASFRHDQGDPDTAFSRGINSIQLLEHDGRLWILSISWDSERPDNPIPDRYLRGAGG